MSTLKILVIGIFMIMAVMTITAMIHLIAPYVAVLLVIGPVLWLITKEKPPDKPPDKPANKVDPDPD